MNNMNNMNNTNSVVAVGQETLNSVMIDILRGAKDVGHDIYGASKAGIIKAVDFAQEQAPLVVQEFCKWKFAEATINAIGCFLAALVLGWVIRKSYITFRKYNDGTDVLGFFGMIIGCIFLVITSIGFIGNLKDAVKISIAPRVYIIDYVTDKVTNAQNNNHR